MRSNRAWGRQHRKAKSFLAPPNGAPCPYCRKPMLPGQTLDADHVVPQALGGGGELRWAHSSCNRRAGAELGNALRNCRIRQSWTDRWA